jgi:hypothetical protein
LQELPNTELIFDAGVVFERERMMSSIRIYLSSSTRSDVFIAIRLRCSLKYQPATRGLPGSPMVEEILHDVSYAGQGA